MKAESRSSRHRDIVALCGTGYLLVLLMNDTIGSLNDGGKHIRKPSTNASRRDASLESKLHMIKHWIMKDARYTNLRLWSFGSAGVASQYASCSKSYGN